MKEEDKIINDYLNPILGDLMKKSLNSIIEMKEQNMLTKDNKQELDFISKFLEDQKTQVSRQVSAGVSNQASNDKLEDEEINWDN